MESMKPKTVLQAINNNSDMYEKATSNTQTCFREVIILTLPTTPFQCRLLPQKGGSSCPPRLRPVGRDMKIGSMLGSSASGRPSCETRDRYAGFQKTEVILLGLPRIKTIAFGVYIRVPYLRKLPYVVLDPCKEKTNAHPDPSVGGLRQVVQFGHGVLDRLFGALCGR